MSQLFPVQDTPSNASNGSNGYTTPVTAVTPLLLKTTEVWLSLPEILRSAQDDRVMGSLSVILNAVKNLEATMEQRGKVTSRADPSTTLTLRSG